MNISLVPWGMLSDTFIMAFEAPDETHLSFAEPTRPPRAAVVAVAEKEEAFDAPAGEPVSTDIVMGARFDDSIPAYCGCLTRTAVVPICQCGPIEPDPMYDPGSM